MPRGIPQPQSTPNPFRRGTAPAAPQPTPSPFTRGVVPGAPPAATKPVQPANVPAQNVGANLAKPPPSTGMLAPPMNYGNLAPPIQPGGRGRIPGMDIEQQQDREAQMALNNILYQQALGGGPSAAQPLLQSAMEQGQRQQMSLAAMGGPAGFAGAQRTQQLAAPGMQAEFGRQGAALRAQEQQAAQGLLGTQLGQQRGQDLAAQMSAAGVLDIGASRDLQSVLGTAGVGLGLGGQELQRGMLGLQADQAQAQALQNQAQMEQQQAQFINQTILGQAATNAQLEAQQPSIMSGVLGGAAGAMGGMAQLGWQPLAGAAGQAATAPAAATPAAAPSPYQRTPNWRMG